MNCADCQIMPAKPAVKSQVPLFGRPNQINEMCASEPRQTFRWFINYAPSLMNLASSNYKLVYSIVCSGSMNKELSHIIPKSCHRKTHQLQFRRFCYSVCLLLPTIYPIKASIFEKDGSEACTTRLVSVFPAHNLHRKWGFNKYVELGLLENQNLMELLNNYHPWIDTQFRPSGRIFCGVT